MDIQIAPVQGEEREGYYVQPLMKRIWAVQLDLLKEIDQICKRHHIKYFGWGGTMLGAVRHCGFIPWDDDMDIAMLREDYERFIYYARAELPNVRKMGRYHPAWLSVFSADRIRLDQRSLDEAHGCPYGIGVDVFCLDRIPRDEIDAQIQLNMFLAVCALCLNWDLPEEDERWKDKSKWEYLEEIEELTGHCIDRRCPIREQLYFLV